MSDLGEGFRDVGKGVGDLGDVGVYGECLGEGEGKG